MPKRLITLDDLIDVYSKARQRGAGFIFSKINVKGESRTKSAFSNTAIKSSNWWIIPKVQERWNSLITGNPNKNYESYLMDDILRDTHNLKLISLGSGECSHEIELAAYNNFEEITCLDIAENRLETAKKIAAQKGLKNMKFICESIYNFNFKESHYDIVFFNASLHHFKNIDTFLKEIIVPTLKPNGKLVINEYVGPDRLQFSKEQIKAVNEALKIIPSKFRKRFKMTLKKSSFQGSGWIRMYLADPSECVDSSSILPSIANYFNGIVKKPYGGNILMNALKDISHHFVELDHEKEAVLERLFQIEDEFLLNHPSDFVFGVYQKK